MGKFIIQKRKDGEYIFSLLASNGQNILRSEGYTTKVNCESGIASVRNNAPIDGRYERLIAVNLKHYFNLRASNGQVIGTSQMYASNVSMENGIRSVKENAPDAPVEDLT